MLVDSDGELENIFDDRLRISKVTKRREVLGNKTNKNYLKDVKKHIEVPIDEEKENVRDNVRDNVRENVRDNIRDNVRDNVRENVRDNVRDNIRENVRDNVRDNVDKDFLITQDTISGNHSFSFPLKNEKLYFSYKKPLEASPPEIRLSLINKELEGLIKKDTAQDTEKYLVEIENEFKKIREAHRKMLMTRNRILKMVEKEIISVKREKNREIKKLEKKLKELAEKQVATNPEPSSRTYSDLLHNYESLEIKYSEQAREVEILKDDNNNLKKQLETVSEKYSKLKSNILQYKNNLDNLYLESLKSIKKRYSK
ncbi:hypothetical protein NGRA_2824 [Nosema granulosis]|uniref:Uncharacterized protein n=1 Tax=Nosema granulosis TaxID=83296 RepID=A0A9P6GWD3_9MICR|nr:hypothetical protein NGRA_2824 [Nosema granulosis]